MMSPLVGIFVGGRSSRMGGSPKGLLKAPLSEQSLVERLFETVRCGLPGSALVLVGLHEAYRHLPLEQIADAAEAAGPRAGLLALCRSARLRGERQVIALACDLPYLGPGLLGRLASFAPEAPALAPRADTYFQPLCARYQADLTEICILNDRAKPNGSLQAILSELGAIELPLSPNEMSELSDWDTPTDVAGKR